MWADYGDGYQVKQWISKSITAALFACAILHATSTVLSAQSEHQSLGIFDGHSDVGTVLHPGNVIYDAAHGTYSITGSGENLWLGKDAFQFLWKKAIG